MIPPDDERAAGPRLLVAEPLTLLGFEPFGQVIEPDNADSIRLINGGTTTRFHDLAKIDVAAEGGRPLVNIFRGKPFSLPLEIAMMERHPLGSQAFVPLHDRPFLIVVAPDEGGRPGKPVAFVARGGQGVNYGRNTWHHPLVSIDAMSDFLVIDRGGEGNNLEEAFYAAPFRIEAL